MHKIRNAITFFAVLFLVTPRVNGAPTTFIMQPVAPQTIPPSSYPPGTTIVGREIILGSVPARVWLEVYVTNWAPAQPRALQIVLDATDRDEDGGGFSGEEAICAGEPTHAADVGPAFVPCVTDADCRAPMSGPQCATAEASQCAQHNFGYWPPGTWCDVAFQNKCHPQWIGTGVEHVAVVDESTQNFRFAIAIFPEEVMPDFEPSYLGTFVVDVPPGAKGSYTLDFVENETFLTGQCGNSGCPEDIHLRATITVPCGRCCFGIGTQAGGCEDGLSALECESRPSPSVFEPNVTCSSAGGADCPECASDEQCDDGQFCNGSELCNATARCHPGEPPCPGSCDEDNDECLAVIPTVSNWGLVVLVLTLMVAAKLRYGRGWVDGTAGI